MHSLGDYDNAVIDYSPSEKLSYSNEGSFDGCKTR